MPHLFSYGTLQLPQVQQERFGRLLDGSPDALTGHRMQMIEITDPRVIATSGTSQHPLVAPSTDAADLVEGTVFEISDAELASADDYEVDDYTRVRVTLRSGRAAWVYLSAAHVER